MINSKILPPIAVLPFILSGGLRRLYRARRHLRWAAITAALLLAVTGSSPGESAGPANFAYVKAAAPVGIVGLPLNVDINLTNGTDVTGWSTEVVFDPAKLQFTNGTFSVTWLQSGGRTAICLGPGELYIPASASTISPLAPGATTIDVNSTGPFIVGKTALIEWDSEAPTDTGGAPLATGGASLHSGGGPFVSYTSTKLTDTSKSWTMNQWAGKVVRSGTNFATIASNTATELTLSPGWSPSTPAAQSSYSIVDAITYSSTTMADPSKAWTSGEWVGKVVRSGSNYATITANDATSLTLSPGWAPSIPTKGSNYQIVPAITYTSMTLTDPTKAWTSNQWAGALVSAGAEFGTVASNTATTLTLTGNWNTITPTKGTAYALDFGPPQSVAEVVTVTAKNPDTPVPGFPGTLTVTRGSQSRGGLQVGGGGTGVTYTSTSVTDTSTPAKSWIPNSLVGGMIVSGTKTGTIASNTPNSITLTAPWTGGTPAGGAPYAVTEIFPTGSEMRIPDPTKRSMGCGTNWFTQDPPPGANGNGKLATVSFMPLATTPVGSPTTLNFGNTTLSNSTGFHAFTLTNTTVQIIACPNLDGVKQIGFGELVKLLQAWNSHGPPNQSSNWNAGADFDLNNVVGFSDFLILLAYWNKVCP